MARNRITRPQNMGQNRNAAMRNNARAQQNRGTFQGGLSRNQGLGPQTPGRSPGRSSVQNRSQCPPGQEPARDPNTGAQTCRPVRANISGNVPVTNAKRAVKPTSGSRY